MTLDAQPQLPDRTLTLPNGTTICGNGPVVIIGPNGSGKTRRAREIVAGCPIEFVNALRNTSIQPKLPAMSLSDADNNFRSARDQSRANHWDWNNEFDMLLAALVAQHATDAINFVDAIRAGQAPAEPANALQQVRDIWAVAFPERELVIRDYNPVIISTTMGARMEYGAHTMSDGERSAIYLAGRVFRAPGGVIVVDEPENHLHSRLAARFWDSLEDARPDLRFVYITHDLTFARSRRDPAYIIASPSGGLQPIEVGSNLSDDVAEVLLGAASLSFHARRLVLCEGGDGDRDATLYRAWFDGRETIVQPVGGSEMVHRCISALGGGWMIGNLRATGIIDRDFHTDEYLTSLPSGMVVLPLHEVESLYCLPGVVSAVATHLGMIFDNGEYLSRLRHSVTVAERHKVIMERWKRRVEPHLIGVVAGVHARQDDLERIIASLPGIFDPAAWGFDVVDLLREERTLLETVADKGTAEELLRLMPGKGRLSVMAQGVGLDVDDYVNLVNASLGGSRALAALAAAVEVALLPHLPSRRDSII